MSEINNDIKWVRERIKYFMPKLICEKADVNYSRLKNWKSGLIKLSEPEAKRLKEAMKDITK